MAAETTAMLMSFRVNTGFLSEPVTTSCGMSFRPTMRAPSRVQARSPLCPSRIRWCLASSSLVCQSYSFSGTEHVSKLLSALADIIHVTEYLTDAGRVVVGAEGAEAYGRRLKQLLLDRSHLEVVR